MGSFRLHRAFLLAVIASLVAAALMGIFVLVFDPRFSDTSERVIATTLTITLFSLTSMGCAIAWERGRWRPVAATGFVVSALSFLLFMPGIWFNIRYPWEDPVYRAMGLGATWSVALPLLCLLALAQLRESWLWARYGTQTVVVVLAVAITGLIIYEWFDDAYGRLLGVLAILTGCGTICVPILHRLSVMPKHDGVVTTGLVLTLTCPRCDEAQQIAAGRSKCRKCGLKFRIEIDEATCSACGYPLYKLTSDRCPECGTPFALGQRNGACAGDAASGGEA